MSDTASHIHLACYGKSDKVNAIDNDNSYFKAGYAQGLLAEGKESLDVISDEWERRGRPDQGFQLAMFKEWKRGFWAARMQSTISKIFNDEP